jgi:hypothetical protein
MEHVVRFPGEGSPDLRLAMALLAEHGFPVQMRMVDGELTMPDEVPPVKWNEVRLGIPSGMVTLLRRGQELHVVTWGNADEAMQRAWNAVAWAVAKAGDGQILRGEGPQGPDAFRVSVPLPDILQK